MNMARTTRFLLTFWLAVFPAMTWAAGPFQEIVRAFEDSDIEFARGKTKVPFLPLGSIDITRYGDTEVQRGEGLEPLTYDQLNVSQFALVPFPVSNRDAIGIGEWMSWSDYTGTSSDLGSFDVFSFALPVGWMRQINPRWQTIAFYMPLGHQSSLSNSKWRWEQMGGIFARYVQKPNLWWAFGFYADIDDGDNLYLPYLGASWSVNESWTISAIMPWPSILYAPTDNTLFRLGMSPSGASWAVSVDEESINFDANSWDFGLSGEHRVHGDFWARLEVGLGGFRSFSYDGSEFNNASLDTDTAGFVGFSVNFRPSVPK